MPNLVEQGIVPTADDFKAYRVENVNQSSVLRFRLYDRLIYPFGGIAELNFFQQQIGQGVTSALGAVPGSAKIKEDTNLTLPGQLSSGLQVLITSMEFLIEPGASAAANTYTPALPSQFAAVASAGLGTQLNDLMTMTQSGLVVMKVLDKEIVVEPNLGWFPPRRFLNISAAVASNSATTAEEALLAGWPDGLTYLLQPPVTLAPNVSFGVKVAYPQPVTLPSGFNARITCILDGYAQRAVQ